MATLSITDGKAAQAAPLPACDDAEIGTMMRFIGSAVTEFEQLLMQVAAGDQRAFRQLYDATSARLLGSARRILGDAALAEDAVQDAYVRIWRSASRFDPARGVALAWMGRIVRNAALDRIPKDRDISRIEDVEIAVMATEPADARVHQCLKKLPEAQAKALVLMYIHGLTHPELAEHLGAPLGTVKSWVRRGSVALRECIGSQT